VTIDLSGDLSGYSWQQIEQAIRARTAETNGYASLMEEPPQIEPVEPVREEDPTMPPIEVPEPLPAAAELEPMVDPAFRPGPTQLGTRSAIRVRAVSRKRAEHFMELYDEHGSLAEVARRVNETAMVVQGALLKHELIDEVDVVVQQISPKTWNEYQRLEAYGRSILNRARVGALTDAEERIMEALSRCSILEEVDNRDPLPAYLRLHEDYTPKRRKHRYPLSARQRKQERWAAHPKAERTQVRSAMRSMGLLPR
jgi:hypothetical protein